MDMETAIGVKQSDARILRETLAKVSKLGNPLVKMYAVKALQAYAAAVKPYCQCPEKVLVSKENMEACLDCGQRHPPTVTPPEQGGIVIP